MKLEIEELKKAIENGEQQVDAARRSLNELQENLKDINSEYEVKKVSSAAKETVLLFFRGSICIYKLDTVVFDFFFVQL